MADKVDMSLDDIIRMNKKSNQRPKRLNNAPLRQTGGGGGQRNTNVMRNNQQRNQRRPNPYSRPTQAKTGDRWKHDLFDGSNKPTRLMIGNLHFRVSDNDIKELFKEFGAIKRAAVHYDKSGRSLGNAEVVFSNKISAIKACEKYNDVLLDGRKMKITIVTDKPIVSQVRPRKPLIGGRLNQQQQGNRPRQAGMNRSNNNNSNNRQGGGRPVNRKQPATKEQLDAELDAYVNKN